MMGRTRTLLFCLFIVALPAASALSAAYVPADQLWPDGVVPYEWDPNIDIGNRFRVLIAMNIWQAVANAQFVLHTDEDDYVLIQDAPGNTGSRSPTIGRGGDKQDLFIRQNLSGISDYGLAHELGHVLGFFHSHQRPDRLSYVTIYNSRITTNGAPNYTPAPEALGYPRNRMDYDSVMSYARCTFTTCSGCNIDCGACLPQLESCRTIEINDSGDAALYDDLMGQRMYLTRIDELTMSFMYPEPNWRFLELNYAGSDESGTFHNPYKTFTTAVDSVPDNGVLWIQPATYDRPTTVITQPMLMRAPLGGVLIR